MKSKTSQFAFKAPPEPFPIDKDRLIRFKNKISAFQRKFDFGIVNLPDIKKWFEEKGYETSIKNYLNNNVPLITALSSKLSLDGVIWIKVKDHQFEIKAVRDETMRARYNANRAREVFDGCIPGPKLSSSEREDLEVKAEAAERFVMNHLGSNGLKTIGEYDGDCDGWIYGNDNRTYSVQVKWTPSGSFCLIPPNLWKKEKADFYVLVIGDEVDKFHVAGWIPGNVIKNNFVKLPNISWKDKWDGWRMGIRKEQMRPFQELIKLCNQPFPGEMIKIHERVISELKKENWEVFKQLTLKENEYLLLTGPKSSFTISDKPIDINDFSQSIVSNFSKEDHDIVEIFPDSELIKNTSTNLHRIYHQVSF